MSVMIFQPCFDEYFWLLRFYWTWSRLAFSKAETGTCWREHGREWAPCPYRLLFCHRNTEEKLVYWSLAALIVNTECSSESQRVWRMEIFSSGFSSCDLLYQLEVSVHTVTYCIWMPYLPIKRRASCEFLDTTLWLASLLTLEQDFDWHVTAWARAYHPIPQWGSSQL